jgi:hypothetical protein
LCFFMLLSHVLIWMTPLLFSCAIYLNSSEPGKRALPGPGKYWALFPPIAVFYGLISTSAVHLESAGLAVARSSSPPTLWEWGAAAPQPAGLRVWRWQWWQWSPVLGPWDPHHHRASRPTASAWVEVRSKSPQPGVVTSRDPGWLLLWPTLSFPPVTRRSARPRAGEGCGREPAASGPSG